MCDQDRHELLNILCKTCSRQRMMPRYMHMANCLNGELTEKCYGGYADVFQGKHKGRLVAVKVVRLYETSDFDRCFSVKALPLHLA